MRYCPCISCNNLNCHPRTSILWLPYFNPPKTKSDPKPWPTDTWRALILCPRCWQFRIHRRADIFWREKTDEEFERYLELITCFRISFLCAVAGCESPAELHIIAEKGIPSSSLEQILRFEGTGGVLPCGHLYGAPDWKTLRIVEGSIMEPLLSYVQ